MNLKFDVLMLTDLALLTDEMVEVPSVIRCNPLCSSREALLYGFWPCTHTAGYKPTCLFSLHEVKHGFVLKMCVQNCACVRGHMIICMFVFTNCNLWRSGRFFTGAFLAQTGQFPGLLHLRVQDSKNQQYSQSLRHVSRRITLYYIM